MSNTNLGSIEDILAMTHFILYKSLLYTPHYFCLLEIMKSFGKILERWIKRNWMTTFYGLIIYMQEEDDQLRKGDGLMTWIL